jgi:hypothetical protein
LALSQMTRRVADSQDVRVEAAKPEAAVCAWLIAGGDGTADAQEQFATTITNRERGAQTEVARRIDGLVTGGSTLEMSRSGLGSVLRSADDDGSFSRRIHGSLFARLIGSNDAAIEGEAVY